jgi:hypothetical protein
MITEFENLSEFKPGNYNVGALHTLLDQVKRLEHRPRFAPPDHGRRMKSHSTASPMMVAGWVGR